MTTAPARVRRATVSVAELARELAAADTVADGLLAAPPLGAGPDEVARTARGASHAPTGARVGQPGAPGTVLLAGPPAAQGADTLASHLARWGSVAGDPVATRAVLEESDIDGRGGGGFPLREKIRVACEAPGTPLLIVNASESEPASAKDATLCRLRPHLVLDGAALVAAVLGTDHAVVRFHDGAPGVADALRGAVAEREGGHGPVGAEPTWSLSAGPDRYVAGEASAVASAVAGGLSRPLFTTGPLAVRGPSGRPTVVANAETLAHLAVAARMGGRAWRDLGGAGDPGTRLVTLAGAVAAPGSVLEVRAGATVGEILEAGGVHRPPAAVLVGGFAGTWAVGTAAWPARFSRSDLAGLGAAPGCGLVAVLPEGACGLSETARIAGYLAGESAGQCGPCAHGLPRLASHLDALVAGRLRRRGLRSAEALADEILGGGACRHPDGVVRLVRSALDVFAGDVEAHLGGRPCAGAAAAPVVAVPARRIVDGREEAWR